MNLTHRPIVLLNASVDRMDEAWHAFQAEQFTLSTYHAYVQPYAARIRMGSPQSRNRDMVTPQQVMMVLRQRFPDLRGNLDPAESGRILGIVISDAFADLVYPERQALIRDTLRDAFSSEQLRNVGPITALTVAEAEGVRDAG